jgi:hypothetical protein
MKALQDAGGDVQKLLLELEAKCQQTVEESPVEQLEAWLKEEGEGEEKSPQYIAVLASTAFMRYTEDKTNEKAQVVMEFADEIYSAIQNVMLSMKQSMTNDIALAVAHVIARA